jgi:RING finger/CHY zinc finger protein 1
MTENLSSLSPSNHTSLSTETRANQISSIMRDSSITPQEKQLRIQRILSSSSSSQSNTTNTTNMNENSATELESMIATAPPPPPPCTHYQKKCSNFFFSCCQVRDACHRCHKELRQCQNPVITEIVCDECGTAQSPGPSCTNCSIQFSVSFCGVCNIWTEKEIYHCYGCKLCRVGKIEDHFHCDTCNGCFLLSSQDHHQCVFRPMNEIDCPLCMDSVHSSQIPGYILPCGHVVHSPCFRKSLRSGNYRCPSCRKSMIDMTTSWDEIRTEIAAQPMPEIISVTYICYDCGSQGSGPFHYLGIECQQCHGFNTSR